MYTEIRFNGNGRDSCPFGSIMYNDDTERCKIDPNERECWSDCPEWCPLKKKDVVVGLIGKESWAPIVKLTKILTLEQLRQAARDKRSVHSPMTWPYMSISHVMPAAVVMNFTGELILRMIERGLFIYQPKGRRRRIGLPRR